MADSRSQRYRWNLGVLSILKSGRGHLRRLLANLKWFLKDVWIDILVIVTLGAIAARIWTAPQNFNRLFPITFINTSDDVVHTEYAYPYRAPPLSALNVTLLCILVPLVAMLLSQIWIQDFMVAASASLGFLYALVCGTLFQVILKKTIGGFRPHFLSVCEPEIPMSSSGGQRGQDVIGGEGGIGFRSLMFKIDQVCRGDHKKISNAIESFPSGHSEIAWASMGFLAIYLAAHLGVFNTSSSQEERGEESQNNKKLGLWRMPLIWAPLLLATYISMGLVLSYNHHWWDVVVGGSIGSFMAILAYRMVFRGVWDGQWNTVPRIVGREEVENDRREAKTRRHAIGNMDGAVLLW